VQPQADRANALKDLLSRKEAAQYLGVSENTLAIWKCTGRYSLPCVKIGRLVKYRRADLDAFIERNVIMKEAA
jgi:excisionase family DNA binding protein